MSDLIYSIADRVSIVRFGQWDSRSPRGKGEEAVTDESFLVFVAMDGWAMVVLIHLHLLGIWTAG